MDGNEGKHRRHTTCFYSTLRPLCWSSLQVNHLSASLLSLLLVPNLVKASSLHGSSSRVVIVSSGTAFSRSFDEEFTKGDFLRKLGIKEYCTPEMMSHRYPDTKRQFPTCIHTVSNNSLRIHISAQHILRQSIRSSSFNPHHLPLSSPIPSVLDSARQNSYVTRLYRSKYYAKPCTSFWDTQLNKDHASWSGLPLARTVKTALM